MARIHRRGWCEGTGGNFSCVLQRQPLQLLMAPSGVDKGRLRPDQLIVVDAGGAVIEGQGRASAETSLHLTIVQVTGAGAVLHTHSQAATLLSRCCAAPVGPGGRHDPAADSLTGPIAAMVSCPDGGMVAASDGSGDSGCKATAAFVQIRGLEMLKGLEGIKTHTGSIQIPVLANDQDLPRLSGAARSHLPGAPYGLLIAGHGLYAWGEDLQQAQRHLEVLEFLLEQRWRELLLARLMGGGA
ncbi:MAG: class II aldolase/adducin family protein [Synechococcus sp.]|nr:class II aldolase/adducin family protein [Synechococcus sp.]